MYLSDPHNVPYVLERTGLDIGELESIVGRFKSNSRWAGRLRGKFTVLKDGTPVIKQSFGNKTLWRG